MTKVIRFSFVLIFVALIMLFSSNAGVTHRVFARTTSPSSVVATPDCNSAKIVLYWGGNLDGDSLCLSGTGTVNLADFPAPWDHGGSVNSWDDHVSSYQVHNASGALFAIKGGLLPITQLSPGDSRSFTNTPYDGEVTSITLN